MMQLLPTQTFQHQGVDWKYQLAVPEGKVKGLIIGMHGAGGNGPQFAENTRIIKPANLRGYAVLIPTGRPANPLKAPNFSLNPNLWNSGNLNPGSARAKIDDVGFFEALLAQIEPDLGKVPLFITGHSNGSGMTYQLAVRWKSKVRAIASVSGQLPPELVSKADKAVPSLFICGSEDTISPWMGGESSTPWGNKRSRPVLEMLKLWGRWNGIKGEFKESKPSSEQTEYEMLGSDRRQVVRVVRLEGHGHAWPSGTKTAIDLAMGPNVTKFDATKAILDWFDRFR